jgi:hypothetical protein
MSKALGNTMNELAPFFKDIRQDCPDVPLVEATIKAAMAIFEAEGDGSVPATETDAPADTTADPATETADAPATEPASDDPNAVDTSLPADDAGLGGMDAGADLGGGDISTDDAAAPDDTAAQDTVDAPPPTGDETPGAVNQEQVPAMPTEEIVTKFVQSGAVREAQDEMVQTKDTDNFEFAKKIAARLAKFCKDNQITTLGVKEGARIAQALAKKYGEKK